MIGKSKIPLQASLLFGNNSLKAFKSEIVLTFALELFDDYYRLRDDSCQKEGVISLDLKSQDDIVIANCIDELSTYLRDNIIKKSDLLAIFTNTNTKDGLVLAKQCEPLGVYYEKLAKLLMHYIPKGGLFIPDYFGILLIHYYKSELGGSFSKYSYIDNYDFQKILGVFERVNITLQNLNLKCNF